MNTFNKYFINTLKNKYFQFEGRARRSEYWYFNLFYFIVYILFMVAAEIMTTISPIFENVIMGFLIIYLLIFFIPSLALTVRRLHDTGKSGWYILINMIPIAGPIIVLVFLVSDSYPGTNQYGPNPKAIETANASDHLIDDLD